MHEELLILNFPIYQQEYTMELLSYKAYIVTLSTDLTYFEARITRKTQA